MFCPEKAPLATIFHRFSSRECSQRSHVTGADRLRRGVRPEPTLPTLHATPQRPSQTPLTLHARTGVAVWPLLWPW